MTGILAALSAEMRTKGVALIQQADRLLCESWNERMWSDRQAGAQPTSMMLTPASMRSQCEPKSRSKLLY